MGTAVLTAGISIKDDFLRGIGESADNKTNARQCAADADVAKAASQIMVRHIKAFERLAKNDCA